MLSSWPLVFGGNHIQVIFAQNIYASEMQNFPCADPPPDKILVTGLSQQICLGFWYLKDKHKTNITFKKRIIDESNE